MAWTREQMAARAAKELRDICVNSASLKTSKQMIQVTVESLLTQ